MQFFKNIFSSLYKVFNSFIVLFLLGLLLTPFIAYTQTCVSSPTTIGGSAFNDYNNNGIKDATDGKQAGILVNVYDCNGALVAGSPVATDANGNWSITGLTFSATSKYRVEFTIPPALTGLQPSANGTDTKTHVQFVSAARCDVNMGVVTQQAACQSSTNPTWLPKGASVLTCIPGTDNVVLAVKDIRQLGTLWNTVTNRNNDQSANVPTLTKWTKDQFGGNKLFSITIDQRDGTIYVGTSELVADVQHSGGSILSTPIPTQIYKIGPLTSTPFLWATMPGDFGIGMLDIDMVHDQILATNIDDGKIYRFALATGAQIGAAYDPLIADNGVRAQLPVTGDAILGVAYNKVENRVYYSVWANNSQPYSIPALASTNLRNTIRSVGLDALGAILPATDRLEITLPFLTRPALPFSEPVIDIEFDATGTKVLLAETGIVSEANITPPFRPASHDAIMVEYVKTAGTWTVSPIPAGNYNSKYDIGLQTNPNVNYYGNNSRGGAAWAYASIANGKIIGDDSFVVATGDALHIGSADADWIYGYQFTPSTGGNRDNSVLVNFGATTGVGTKYTFNDVDIFKGIYCETKIEIGNFAWIDTDKDGVQDPCELPLAGVKVSLYKDIAGTLTKIAETSTSATGEYYFSNNTAIGVTWTGTGADIALLPNQNYKIVFGETQYTANQLTIAGANYSLTTANATTNTGNDHNDSDATTMTIGGALYPSISLTTGAAGSNNHTFDVGFYSCPSITTPTGAQTICLGTTGTNFTVKTDQNTANSIKFVKFSDDKMLGTTPTTVEAATIYAGTAIGSAVTPTGGTSPYTATYTWKSTDFAVAGTYYIYAILSPDAGASCRPVQEIVVVVQQCCPTTICLPVTLTRN